MNRRHGRVSSELLAAICCGLIVSLAGGCKKTDNRGDPLPSPGAVGSLKTLVATQFFPPNGQHDPQPDALARVSDIFQAEQISFLPVFVNQAQRPPDISAYCSYGGFICSSCDGFYSDQTEAENHCGTRNALGLYAYYYRTGAAVALYSKYEWTLFYVTPGFSATGQRDELGTYVYEPNCTSDTCGLFDAGFVFQNQVQDAMSDWGISGFTREDDDWRIIGYVAAHELGHLAYKLEDANYDDSSDPINVYHNLTFSPSQCVMGTPIGKADAVDNDTPMFCFDFIPDLIDTNTCRDNIRRRATP